MAFSKIPQLIKLFSQAQDPSFIITSFDKLLSSSPQVRSDVYEFFDVKNISSKDLLNKIGIKTMKKELAFYYWANDRVLYSHRSAIKIVFMQFLDYMDDTFYPFESVNKAKNYLIAYYFLDQHIADEISYDGFKVFVDKLKNKLALVAQILQTCKIKASVQLDWVVLTALFLEQLNLDYENKSLISAVENLNEEQKVAWLKTQLKYSFALDENLIEEQTV